MNCHRVGVDPACSEEGPDRGWGHEPRATVGSVGALVAESIKADPQLSNREHAKRTGVDKNTVSAVRDELESTGEIHQLERTVGADGKERPATKPRPVVDSAPRQPDPSIDHSNRETESAPGMTADELLVSDLDGFEVSIVDQVAQINPYSFWGLMG